MTNTIPQGSSGAPPAHYSIPSTGMAPRRSSYASVAAGTAGNSSQNQSTPTRSGAFSHLLNPNPALPDDSPQIQDSDRRSPNSQHSPDRIIQANGVGAVPYLWGKGGNTYAQNFSNRYTFGSGNGLSDILTPGNSGFFKPSYLRNSKYMEKLEAAHLAKLAIQRETVTTHSSNPGSLSTSSSSVSLHRMAPSHRGMTYEIVEHQPVVEEDGLSPLPSKWAELDRFGGLEVGADGLDIRYTGTQKTQDHEAASARTDHPMPPQCGIYYYEATIVSRGKEGLIGIGFSGSKASLEKLPGWEPESWAYHGDDGNSFCCQSPAKQFGPKFTTNDVIGCGVNFKTGCAFFTKNGINQGIAFRDLKDVKLYPSIGMKRAGAHLRVNFGQTPFLFDIDGMMTSESLQVREEINSVNVAFLSPPLSEDALIKELVAQFLAHDGYVETAKAFAREVKLEANSLNGTDTVMNEVEVEDGFQAVKRQKVRAAILDGDIDLALQRTYKYYPEVLEQNQQINFRLRCRKFIELMRQTADLRKASTDSQPKKVNGHSDHIFGQAMELDDPVSMEGDWDRMETEEIENGARYSAKLQETLGYGQTLQIEFGDKQSKEVKDSLKDIFAMFAYEDPWKSPTAHLLEQSGRVVVAEELNSAILVSLGKSPSAAIERLCQQTEILVHDISEEGGAGAFINVHNDFLR